MGWIVLLDKVLGLAIVGLLTIEKAQQIKSQIEQMQAEGRDPTDEEVNALFDGLDAAIAELKGHADRLNP